MSEKIRVDTIALRDFKSQNCTHALEALNLVTGQNGSGKSAIAAALWFAKAGETSIGKTAGAATPLCGPGGGSVTVALDNGKAWTRTATRDEETGSASTSIGIAGAAPDGVKSAQIQIDKWCGVFPEGFNLRVFTGLSGERRREYLVALLSGSEAGDVDYAALLGQIVAECPRTIGVEFVAEIADERLWEITTEIEAALLASMAGSPAEAVQCMIKDAKKMGDKAGAAANEARQAARSLAQRIADLPLVAQTTDVIEAELATAREQRQAITDQIANQDGRKASISGEEEAIQSAETSKADVVERLELLRAQDYDALQATADRLAEDSRAADPGEPPSDAVALGLREPMYEARNQRVDAEDRLRLRATQAEKARAEALRVAAEAEAAKGDPWRVMVDHLLALVAVRPDLEELPQWEAVVCHASKQPAPNIVTISKAIPEASKAHVDSIAKEVIAQAAVNEYVIAEAGAKAAYDQAVADHDAAMKQHRVDAKTYNTANGAANLASKAVETHATAVTDAEKRIGDFDTIITERNGRLDSLRAEGGFLPDETLQQQLAAADAVIAGRASAIEARRGADVLGAEQLERTAVAQGELLREDTCKRVVKAGRKVREGLLRDMLARFIGPIDTFIKAAWGEDYRAYCRLERTAGNGAVSLAFDLGLQKPGGTNVSVDALSGGEQSIYCAALTYALVQLADPPLKLLLIEAAEADGENLRRLLTACEAVSGDLSNVVVATHRDPGEWPGWNRIEMGEGVAS